MQEGKRQMGIGIRAGIPMLVLAMVGGCHGKEPNGQVLANVNDDVITQRDLATELQVAQVPSNADIKLIAPSAMNALIDRKLAIAEAKRIELDKSPDVLALTRRASEVILGQALLQKWQSELPEPSGAEIQDFIATNPQLFSERKLMQADQIQLPAEAVKLDALRGQPTMDALIRFLDSRKIPYTRGKGVIASTDVSPAENAALATAPTGQPVPLLRGNAVTVVSVLAVQPAPVSAAAINKTAIDMIKHNQVLEKVAQLHRSAKISYQPGAPLQQSNANSAK